MYVGTTFRVAFLFSYLRHLKLYVRMISIDAMHQSLYPGITLGNGGQMYLELHIEIYNYCSTYSLIAN